MFLFFYSTTCPSCHTLMPLLPENTKQINIDLNENYDEACLYNVRTVPTLLQLDEEGVEILRLERPQPYEMEQF